MNTLFVTRIASRLLAVLFSLRAIRLILTTIRVSLQTDVSLASTLQQTPVIFGVYVGCAVFLWFRGAVLAKRVECDDNSPLRISDSRVVSLILPFLGALILVNGALGTTTAFMNRITIGPASDLLQINLVAQGLTGVFVGFLFVLCPHSLTNGLSKAKSSHSVNRVVRNGSIVVGFWVVSEATANLGGMVISGIIRVLGVSGVAYARMSISDLSLILITLLLGLWLIFKADYPARVLTCCD